MPYSDIPDHYQPPAIHTRAATIADTPTGMVKSDRSQAEKDLYVEDLKREQDTHAANLLRIVIEQAGDASRENKADYMILTARRVIAADLVKLGEILTLRERSLLGGFRHLLLRILNRTRERSSDSEVPAGSRPTIPDAAYRHAATDLGLEYFVRNPRIFLESLSTTTHPDQQDLNRIGHLLRVRSIARADYFKALPAPAALAAIGTVNALTFALKIEAEHTADRATIPYYLSIAAAWNHIGQQLNADSSPETPVSTDGDTAWSPWLNFLKDL